MIVNLGGFVNLTRLPAENEGPSGITGGDVCACNQILDAISRRSFETPFDEDGQRAESGKVDESAFADLRGVLESQAEGGRSLGTGDEATAWIERQVPRVTGADLAATACAAIARTIVDAAGVDTQILLAGGGVRNARLVREMTAAHQGLVQTTAVCDVEIQARESVAMAVLGAMCADRVPITLSAVTHCESPAPIAGAWVYPPQ